LTGCSGRETFFSKRGQNGSRLLLVGDRGSQKGSTLLVRWGSNCAGGGSVVQSPVSPDLEKCPLSCGRFARCWRNRRGPGEPFGNHAFQDLPLTPRTGAVSEPRSRIGAGRPTLLLAFNRPRAQRRERFSSTEHETPPHARGTVGKLRTGGLKGGRPAGVRNHPPHIWPACTHEPAAPPPTSDEGRQLSRSGVW